MPKRNKVVVSRRKRANVRNRRNFNHRKRGKSIMQTVPVHRRLVAFPDTADSTWLQKLTWFGSVTLKLITMLLGVNKNSEGFVVGEEATVASGSALFLGPGDFASVSPFATPVITRVTDKEVIALRAFPYERATLRSLSAKIVPSADLGARGGMYAARLVRLDSVDDTSLPAQDLIEKYPFDYDTIIKSPDAKLQPVTSTVTLNLKFTERPHNIRSSWDAARGFVNTYPLCVLCVAYSDMATKKSEIASNYSPAKAGFEIHLNGQLSLCDPGDIQSDVPKSSASHAAYTGKILHLNQKNINVGVSDKGTSRSVRFFDRTFEVSTEQFRLMDIPADESERMLTWFNRLDLLDDLNNNRLTDQAIASLASMELP